MQSRRTQMNVAILIMPRNTDPIESIASQGEGSRFKVPGGSNVRRQRRPRLWEEPTVHDGVSGKSVAIGSKSSGPVRESSELELRYPRPVIARGATIAVRQRTMSRTKLNYKQKKPRVYQQRKKN